MNRVLRRHRAGSRPAARSGGDVHPPHASRERWQVVGRGRRAGERGRGKVRAAGWTLAPTRAGHQDHGGREANRSVALLGLAGERTRRAVKMFTRLRRQQAVGHARRAGGTCRARGRGGKRRRLVTRNLMFAPAAYH